MTAHMDPRPQNYDTDSGLVTITTEAMDMSMTLQPLTKELKMIDKDGENLLTKSKGELQGILIAIIYSLGDLISEMY